VYRSEEVFVHPLTKKLKPDEVSDYVTVKTYEAIRSDGVDVKVSLSYKYGELYRVYIRFGVIIISYEDLEKI
jgi:hypothetical protein